MAFLEFSSVVRSVGVNSGKEQLFSLKEIILISNSQRIINSQIILKSSGFRQVITMSMQLKKKERKKTRMGACTVN